MKSMTGYGKASYISKTQTIDVEISSVNNRFLEYSIKLPRDLSSLEPRVKELISGKVQRGKINVNVVYEENGAEAGKLVLDKSLAKNIFSNLQALKKTYKLAGEIQLNHFLNFPEILKIEKTNNFEEKIWTKLKKTIDKALAEMVSMRIKEGANLKKDISARLKKLLDKIKRIESLSAQNKNIHRERLTKKLDDLLGGRVVDKNRLEEEIAYIVERSDITEECIRFKSHIQQFQTTLKQDNSVGKKINFILQELNRESNTIGSKAANTDIAYITLEMKEGIEKIREQIQNIE